MCILYIYKRTYTLEILFNISFNLFIGVFEQGSGLLNIDAAMAALAVHTPHSSLLPPRVSNLKQDCPHLWPWCTYAMYRTARPLIVNFTLLNSMDLTGRVVKIQWVESYSDTYTEGSGMNHTHNSKGNPLDNGNTVTVLIGKKLKKSNSQTLKYTSSSSSSQEHSSPSQEYSSTLEDHSSNKSSAREPTPLITRSTAKPIKKSYRDGDIITLQGAVLTLRIRLSDILYPYTGYIGVAITGKTKSLVFHIRRFIMHYLSGSCMSSVIFWLGLYANVGLVESRFCNPLPCCDFT
jgi:hypothetical protein